MKSILKIALVSVGLIICCNSSTVGAMYVYEKVENEGNSLLSLLSGIDGEEEDTTCDQNSDRGKLLSSCVKRDAFSEINRPDVVKFLIAAFKAVPDWHDEDSVNKYWADRAGTMYAGAEWEEKVADFLALLYIEPCWTMLAGIIGKDKADDFRARISDEGSRAQLARIICKEKNDDFMTWISNIAHKTELAGIIREENAVDFTALIYQVAYWTKLARIICKEKAADFMALIPQEYFMTNSPVGMLLCSYSRWWTAETATAIKCSWSHVDEDLLDGLYNALIERAYFSSFHQIYDLYSCVGDTWWPYLSKNNKLKLFFDLYCSWNLHGSASAFINAYTLTTEGVLYEMVERLCKIPLVQVTTLYYCRNGAERESFASEFEKWICSCIEQLKKGQHFSELWTIYRDEFETRFQEEEVLDCVVTSFIFPRGPSIELI